MPDDRIYDAVNLFKFSATGRGLHTVGGDPVYRQRYNKLVRDVLNELWSLWQRDEIKFVALGPEIIGDSARRAGADIRVNLELSPADRPVVYGMPANQALLAGTSLNIVHEAVHLVRDISSYPEEETVCRTLQLLYFQDLQTGVRYTSRITNQSHTAKLLPEGTFLPSLIGDYHFRLQKYRLGQLIDQVLSMQTYRDYLTADFIRRSMRWWGGIRNRWLTTRGYYLRVLADDGPANQTLILEILESIPSHADWTIVRRTLTDADIKRIREVFSAGHALYTAAPYVQRVAAVQRITRENFGVRS